MPELTELSVPFALMMSLGFFALIGMLRGAYAQLAVVVLAAVALWAFFWPDLQPGLQTPKGRWEVQVRSDARRMIYPLSCEYTDAGASGEVVNMGAETARAVIEVVDSRHPRQILVPLLVPGVPTRWEIELKDQTLWREAGRPLYPSVGDINGRCRSRVVAAERVEEAAGRP